MLTLKQINKQLKQLNKLLKESKKINCLDLSEKLEKEIAILENEKVNRKQRVENLSFSVIKKNIILATTKEDKSVWREFYKEKKKYISQDKKGNRKNILPEVGSAAAIATMAIVSFFGSKMIVKNLNKSNDNNKDSQESVLDNNDIDNKDRIMETTGVSENQIDELINNNDKDLLISPDESTIKSDTNTSNDRIVYTTTPQSTITSETIVENEITMPSNDSTTVIKEEIITEPDDNSYMEITSDPEDIIREEDNIPTDEIIHDGGTKEEIEENNPSIIEEDEEDIIYYDDEEEYIPSIPDDMPIEEDEEDVIYYNEATEEQPYVLTLRY